MTNTTPGVINGIKVVIYWKKAYETTEREKDKKRETGRKRQAHANAETKMTLRLALIGPSR